jgi:hypothetical protein
MRGCLDDEALMLLRYGEGPESDRQHLAGCLPCAARSHRLGRDLAAIGDALEEGQPRRSAGAARRGRRLAALAAAVVALAALATGEAWLGRAFRSMAPPRAALDTETVVFLEDVATFLSGDGDANPMMPEFMPESNGAATIGLDAATPER